MDLLTAIKTRRSVRNFADEPVEKEDLNKILEAANWAPSARNQQPWRFIVIKNKELSEQLAAEVHKKLDDIEEKARKETDSQLLEKVRHYRVPFTFFSRAPITVAVVQTPYIGTGLAKEVGVDASKYDSALQSISAAIQNFLLAAHALNYGSCWMTGPLIAYPEVSKLLNIKEDEQLVALLPLGKYSLAPKAKPRKSTDQVVTIID